MIDLGQFNVINHQLRKWGYRSSDVPKMSHLYIYTWRLNKRHLLDPFGRTLRFLNAFGSVSSRGDPLESYLWRTADVKKTAKLR